MDPHRADPQAELRLVPASELGRYLTARSGLPGPRGNLELADAFAAVAGRETILSFAALEDEYLRFCGTQALGRLMVEEPDNAQLPALARERAGESRWRVREAASRALQLVGDADPARLCRMVEEWLADPDPYVRRAAVAAICEPRLLREASTARTALAACRRASASILAIPAAERRRPAVRTLRQGLGYCWSVAVAADPAAGLPAFEALRAVADPDMQWIVESNLKKARLQRLLGPSAPGGADGA